MSGSHDGPPVFDGSVGEYREWRRRAELWTMSTKVPPEKKGARLGNGLEKATWDATRHLTVAQLTADDGKDKVLEALDLAFAEADD
eukprot:2375338-Amphidinium_carterae.1